MAFKSIFVYPNYPKRLERLFDLAYNLWSLWDYGALGLFERIDAQLFRNVGGNPVEFLYALPRDRRTELAEDPGFLAELDKVYSKYRRETFPVESPSIAYFSMEFGLHVLPIYAGGLGMLAGDIMKGSSDMGLPMIGVGLYYRYGYFKQRITLDGNQEETYTEADIPYLPMREQKDVNDRALYIDLPIDGSTIRLKVWNVRIGRLTLLLLDANLPENTPQYRDVTDYLYVADREKRILQEIILGRGGFIALRAAGITPKVYHLNEGHSAFLIIERLGRLIQTDGRSLEEATAIIRNTTVFTTHTPVQAGNESFPVEMVRRFLKDTVEGIGISFDDFLSWGFHADTETFWLPAFALRFCRYVNGVSAIHAGVSRSMWKGIYPAQKLADVPIRPITNGVHCSWFSPELMDLFTDQLGECPMNPGVRKEFEKTITRLPDTELWDIHMKCKRRMVSYLRQRFIEYWTAKGRSASFMEKAKDLLNTNFLTVAFARRFASYKRPTLIFNDPERFVRILKNPHRPVQVIFAGKAHPADTGGKEMIKAVMDFAREYDVEDRLLFVEGYDRKIAEHLVQGVDVWLNNPIKPNEASGTSGMKAGINGVLNLSVLDGWWPECYNERNGWAISAGDYYDHQDARDRAEASQIYDLLEGEISDLYYRRSENDVPHEWIEMMKESIRTVTTGFGENRMLGEYRADFYLPALEASDELCVGGSPKLDRMVAMMKKMQKHWDLIRFDTVETDLDSLERVSTGDTLSAYCIASIDGIDPEDLTVELCLNHRRGDGMIVAPLPFAGSEPDGRARFSGSAVVAASGLLEMDFRIVPADPDIRGTYPELIKWA